MDAPIRTLVIAPTPAAAAEAARVLIAAGLQVGARRIETGQELARVLGAEPDGWDLVLCAAHPELSPGEALRTVREAEAELPVVAIGAAGGTLTDATSGVLALAAERPPEEAALAVRRELALAATRQAARRATAALDLRDRALASAGNGIVIADARQQGFPAVYVNPSFERMTGWTSAQMVGQSCALLQGARTERAAIAELSAALREGRECRVTLLNYRRDGSTFWNDVALSPVRDGDGAVTHVVGVLDDVSDRVETLERLRDVESEAGALASGLAEVEALYRQLVEHIPAITYVSEWDESGTLRYVSPQVEAMLGRRAEEFIADRGLWDSLIHPDDIERVRGETRRSYEQERDFEIEFRMLTADGRELWVWERDRVVRDPEGAPQYTQGVVLDVTSLRTTEAALRDERDRAQRYLEVAGTIIVVLDADEGIALLNRTGHELLGYEDGSLLGRNWFDECVPPDTREEVRRAFHELVDGDRDPGTATHESDVLTRDGGRRTVAWQHSLIRGEDGAVTATLSSGVDITERRRAEERIAFLAYHDSLTGLPNRALLHEHLDLALARAQRGERAVALLYLDLDDFKLVNDSLGHSAGDELLVQVATRLGERRRGADLLARHGGDEFLVLLADLEGDPERAAVGAAEGMLETLARPFRIEGAEFALTASIGVSVCPGDAHDAETLMRHADAAMYEAKSGGKGGVRVFSGSVREPLERLSLTGRLRSALEHQEYLLHWQPIVDPVQGSVHALEALIRWDDPERGPIMPVDFLGVAEETGVVERIGEWVVEAVCLQRLAWRSEGLDPAVAVNASPRELRSGFADLLLDRLAHHRLDPGKVTVEVSESAVTTERAATEGALRALAAGGVRVAIDDFGAGPSALAHLRELPITALKLDRAFLREVPGSEEAETIVAALIGMAAGLGLELVAEGVETEAQRRFLVEHSCPLAQGFLFARPAPALDLDALLRGATALA
jgi:diguanylate cyclase (GGDEF)-like protein/PAS domain S-box-containing protein